MMTNIKEENQDEEEEWVAAAKLKGPIPFVEPNRVQSGSWSSPPAGSFMVRGPHYFKTKTKIPGDSYLFKPLAFDWIKGGDTKISDILSKYPNHRVRIAVDASDEKPFVFAFNFQLPTEDHHSIVAYFYARDPPRTRSSLVGRFLSGDDDRFRNSRLKLIVNMVRGPWIVTKAVGEQAIALIGRSLECTYRFSEDNNNFVEVGIDVGSSMVATALCHLCFRYFKSLTVDMAFVVEAREESELPERVLGAFRFSGLEDSLAVPVGDA